MLRPVDRTTSATAPPDAPAATARRGASPPPPSALDRSDCNPPRKLNVMAPLLVGDPSAPRSKASKAAFADFERMLREAKAAGVQAVTTDVWWGLVEPKDGQFDFSHYDRIADVIERVGLKWVPILSFHQCGGNVGDTVNIPIPDYLADKYSHLSDEGRASAFFRSEQGNISYESLSPWASARALPDYREAMTAFSEHFATRAHLITEVNVSLGPAGELRYPSYNSHDQGTDYPTRGALQAYGSLARQDFQRFVLDKYGDLKGIAHAWGTPVSELSQVRPPDDAGAFFARGDDKNTEYGRDFFDWYHRALVEHGKRIIETAQDVFGAPGSPFEKIPVGAKVAGVHWRIGSDRAAELAAGLIRSRDLVAGQPSGHEYDRLVRTFAELDARSPTPLILHFTCLEKADRGDERPASLVRWVGESAARHGVTLAGENALPMSYEGPEGWTRIQRALDSHYDGITILRLPVARSAWQGLLDLGSRYVKACVNGALNALEPR